MVMILKNTEKYMDELYVVYTKNLEIVNNIIEDEKNTFNFPSLKQDEVSNFVFSQYPDINENIKAYFRFKLYTTILVNFLSEFSIDNELKFIEFIDIEKNRDHLPYL